MNKRIQLLAEQSTTYTWVPGTGTRVDFDQEKFARLIVQECANRATWAQDTNEEDIGGEVLKHFGVE